MSSPTATVTVGTWDGPGVAGRREPLSWHRLLWAMVFPKRRQRISLTVPGLFLVALALGIGSAAYNTASNILFITLSLLLACLLLSGLLSWFNFMKLRWRLRPLGPWRAGHETLVTVEVENQKRWLPSYSLWFEFASQPRSIPDPDAGGRDLSLRKILAAAEKFITRGRIFLRDRIEPGGSVTVDWILKPTRRGEALVELAAVGSLFPFGFLRKFIGTDLRHPVIVWPAQVKYQWTGGVPARVGNSGRRTARAGTGEDLLSLRKYRQGDSHRLIHWKASARLAQLMIRQLSAETHEGYFLKLDTRGPGWGEADQFELLCSFAATLAEDLFAAGRLQGVVLNGGAPLETRRLRDVELFLDDLARLQPLADDGLFRPGSARRANVITFSPAFPPMSMVAKSHQLNLDELLRLKWLLGGAMALVGLWTVFFLDIEALSLVAIVSAGLLATQIWPGLPRRVPAIVWKLAVPGIIVAMVADFWTSPDTLPVMIRLAILLVLYRGVSHRRKREDLQLLVLALFLIVVAGVLTVSIGFAFLLVAFTACALGFLFVINLIESLETGALRTEEAATAWTRLPWRGFAGRLWRVADWRLLAFASVLFLTVVAMSGVLFTIIPRFELASGFFLDKYITRKSRAGFSDTLRFGDVTELAQDNGVALRVDLTDGQSVTEAPYWRLAVLDEYSADGFRVSQGLKNELLGSETRQQLLRAPPSTRRRTLVGGTWTFYLEPGVSRYLPLPGTYGLLALRDMTMVQRSDITRIVALRVEPVTMTAFRLEEVALTSEWPDTRFAQRLRQAEAEPLSPRQYDPRLTLRGPQGLPNEEVLRRVRNEISGGATLSADEFARRAIAWLRGRHAYALSVRIPSGDGRDGIVRWLDSNEPGFCEYFAAGLTVLARSAGHPARVVTGFHGGARNAFENYFMVRNSDAHAWVEIYDGSSAWRRFDPTPGGLSANANAIADNDSGKQDSSWSARIDSLRVLWYRRIVNFDSRQQLQMLEQAKTFTTDSGTALRERFETFGKKVKAWFSGPWNAGRVIKVLALVLAGPWLLWTLGRLLGAAWRRWHGAGKGGELEPVRRAAGRWIGRLRDHPPGIEVIDDLRRLRYGRKESWPEPRGVFRRARAARQRAKRDA